MSLWALAGSFRRSPNPLPCIDPRSLSSREAMGELCEPSESSKLHVPCLFSVPTPLSWLTPVFPSRLKCHLLQEVFPYCQQLCALFGAFLLSVYSLFHLCTGSLFHTVVVPGPNPKQGSWAELNTYSWSECPMPVSAGVTVLISAFITLCASLEVSFHLTF